MPPESARAAETREWLAKAELDLKAAEFEFTASPPLTADIVFHCQQLAEKALKALLAWHEVPFRKTHNLIEIGQQCVAVDQSLESLLRRAAVLTEYAWRFRYPGEPTEPDVEEAGEAFALAREVYEAIAARLPADTRA
jgi:HEPN domain-containing protein